MSKLFALNEGDVFSLNGKKYKVKGFFYKKMPRLGRMYHCKVTEVRTGDVQYFISNHEVTKENADE